MTDSLPSFHIKKKKKRINRSRVYEASTKLSPEDPYETSWIHEAAG